MNTLQKTILTVGLLSVLGCYVLTQGLTFLVSKGVFEPTPAKAGPSSSPAKMSPAPAKVSPPPSKALDLQLSLSSRG